MATNKDSLSEKLLGGFEGTKNTLNTTKLAETIAQGISKRLSTIGNSGNLLGGKTVGKIDTALYTSVSEGQYQRLRRGDGVADVAAKLVNLIILSDEEKKLHHELDRNFEQEELYEAKKLKEVDIEPETIAELDDKTDRKIFDNYNKLDLVARLGKLWFWSKNIVKWAAGKLIRFGLKSLKFILPKTPVGRVITAGVVLGTALYNAIAGSESGGNYNAIFGHNTGDTEIQKEYGKSLTELTIAQVQKIQKQRESTNQNAVGKYQFMSGTLSGLIKQNNIDPETTTFSPEIQEKLQETFIQNNIDILKKGGVEITPGNLKMAHYIGPQGTVELYQDLAAGKDITVSESLSGHGHKYGKQNKELVRTKIKDFPAMMDKNMEKYMAKESSLAEMSENPITSGIELNKQSIDYNTMLEDEQFKQNLLIINNNNTIIQPVRGGQTSMSSSTSPDPNLYELSTMMVYPDGQ